MSGSYDRPALPRRRQAIPDTGDDLGELYRDPPTGPSTHHLPKLEPSGRSDLRVHSRDRAPERDPARTSIVPAGSVTGRSLTLVITIMCFLACLTAGAVYMINESASAWMRDIASEVTVQVEPIEGADIEKTVADVAQFMRRQPGVIGVRPLSATDNAALLEPWLGQSEALKSLPMPRLIAIELDRGAPPDFSAVKQALTKEYRGVNLDDHRQWQQQIRSVTRSLALGGIAILILVGAATTAIIVSATRSAMASNREIVEVLHLVGANDRFIAREFSRHFLRLGVRAGCVGAVLAMAVFVAMPTIMQLLGGGALSMAEMQRLLGSGALDFQGYMILVGVVIVISALCMITSRLGVYRILQSQP
jgi:cell division transport system permease protein